MSEALENRVLGVMSALIDAGLGAEARFVHQLWRENEELRVERDELLLEKASRSASAEE